MSRASATQIEVGKCLELSEGRSQRKRARPQRVHPWPAPPRGCCIAPQVAWSHSCSRQRAARLEICSSSGERSPRLRTLSRRTSDSSCQQQAMALRLLCLLAACLACASGFAAPLSRAAVQPRSSEVCMTTAASKATRVNRRNREYNKQYKSEMRTRIKRVRGRCRFLRPFFRADRHSERLHFPRFLIR